ncbi:MAG: NAD(P)H-dependent oxidoreductase [Bacteroidales bacterium]
MLIVDNQLKKRELASRPIKIGVIGAGVMGTGIINQINRYTPGITIGAVYNRTLEKGLLALKIAGVKNYRVIDNLQDYHDCLNQNITVLTQNIDLLIEGDGIDVLVEVTGTIDFASHVILKAFSRKKNILSFNVEIDATFGPLLKVKAKESGVGYSVADGDQPGVTMNLYRFVKTMGFTPLLCGNIKGLQDHYRTPATQAGFAKQWDMSAEMVTSFADGTKISFEQACIANATNMKVAIRGMYGYNSTEHVDNLTRLFDIEQLRELGGIVDYVVGAKPSPGVFIYASADDPFSARILKYAKLGDGPLYSFYIPYHLLFFEIASSICRLVDFDDPVIIPQNGPVVEVIATAKTDLAPGDILDGLGGFKAYGVCENTGIARKENLLPMGLIENLKVTKPVKKDQVLTFNDVELSADNFVISLFNEQQRLFS